MKKTIFTISLLLLPFSAFAQLYKCTENGKTTFSDQPCGKNTVTIKKDPNSHIPKGNWTPAEEKQCAEELRKWMYDRDTYLVGNPTKERVLRVSNIERTHGSCAAAQVVAKEFRREPSRNL